MLSLLALLFHFPTLSTKSHILNRMPIQVLDPLLHKQWQIPPKLNSTQRLPVNGIYDYFKTILTLRWNFNIIKSLLFRWKGVWSGQWFGVKWNNSSCKWCHDCARCQQCKISLVFFFFLKKQKSTKSVHRSLNHSLTHSQLKDVSQQLRHHARRKLGALSYDSPLNGSSTVTEASRKDDEREIAKFFEEVRQGEVDGRAAFDDSKTHQNIKSNMRSKLGPLAPRQE